MTVILAAGCFPTTQQVLSLLDQADFIACCDGAANSCVAAGFTPDVIVGDGDSIAPNVRAQFSDRIVQISEQETNDLTKTFHHCLALGHTDITLLGATGKREDHELGNIALLMDFLDELHARCTSPRLRMVSDYGTFLPCRDQLEATVEVGCEVSIFNFGATHFSSEGLQYPLYDFQRLWQGTLNEAVQSCISICAHGKFLVYVSNAD